jgi:hypothetical protein
MFTTSELADFPTTIGNMALAHGLPVVARRDVARFTCGLLAGRTLANLDSRGEGPGEKVSIGKSVGYPTLIFCKWLTGRLKVTRGKRPVAVEA